jgi:hypothetical protein
MGAAGCGAIVPEPVVLGGAALRTGAEPVVTGDGLLLAVLLPLLFQPATSTKAISAKTASPAIQPHIPPTFSSRRSAGSLNRGSVYRGSDMAFLHMLETHEKRLQY